MLKLTFGIWKNENGKMYGKFSIFGRTFIAFMEQRDKAREGSPDYTISIQEVKGQ